MAKEIALITGANSGIGLSLCETLLSDGWRVIAIDLQLENLDSLKLNHAERLQTFKSDVRNLANFEVIVQDLKFQKNWIDLWVNCAGVSGLGEFSKTSKEDFDRTLDINLVSVVNLTRLALQHMSGRGKGCVCNIASVAGFVSAPMMSAYCLTKHALVGFSRSLQAELKMSGSPLRILLASPGFVDTEIIQKGQDVGFPNWLSPLLARPKTVSRDILKAYRSGQDEIVPTLNGKVMLALQRWAPWVLGSSRRLLTARTLTDLFLNRY